MTINLDAAYKSIIKNAVVNSTKALVKNFGERKLQALRKEAKEWKLDVKAWLNTTSRISNYDDRGTGISTSGPMRKTGQLRRAAGNYTINKTSADSKGNFSIITTTKFAQVRSYSRGQKSYYNYSNILDESTGHYYSGYKDRYRNILYKRMEDIIHGNL